MKIEHKKQQKNRLLMDKSVLDLKWYVVFSHQKKKKKNHPFFAVKVLL